MPSNQFNPSWIRGSADDCKSLRTTIMKMKTLLLISLLCTLAAVKAQFDGHDYYLATTLEIMFSRAQNTLVEDGTWASIFGNLVGVYSDAYCTGGPQYWPVSGPILGTDLALVVTSSVFKCGMVKNTLELDNAGNIILQTDDSGASGPIVVWWDALAAEVSRVLQMTNIEVEWEIYITSQEALTALYLGGVDALCSYGTPYGVWIPTNSSDPIPTALAFSTQHCTTLVQRELIYVPAGRNITSFDELLVKILESPGEKNVCAAGSTGGSDQVICQSTWDQYLTNNQTDNATVTCVGAGNESFNSTLNGTCYAAWSGYPGDQIDLFDPGFEQPVVYSPVSFFRQADLVNGTSDGYEYVQTTLEIAVTRSFNNLIQSGVYASYFEYSTLDSAPLTSCIGQPWPLPDALPGSDLAAVLANKVFTCSYVASQVTMMSNNEVVLVNSTDPNNVTGLLVEFWNALIADMGVAYNTELSVKWDLEEISQDCIDSLLAGGADSLCGYWAPNGIWKDAQNFVHARGLFLSTMQCPTFLERRQIYTLAGSTITTFQELLVAIDDGSVSSDVCVSALRSGGFLTECIDLFAQYATSLVSCIPYDQLAFDGLLANNCSAVYGGFPEDPRMFNSIALPNPSAVVSFFRTYDINSTPTAPTTSNAPASPNGPTVPTPPSPPSPALPTLTSSSVTSTGEVSKILLAVAFLFGGLLH